MKTLIALLALCFISHLSAEQYQNKPLGFSVEVPDNLHHALEVYYHDSDVELDFYWSDFSKDPFSAVAVFTTPRLHYLNGLEQVLRSLENIEQALLDEGEIFDQFNIEPIGPFEMRDLSPIESYKMVFHAEGAVFESIVHIFHRFDELVVVATILASENSSSLDIETFSDSVLQTVKFSSKRWWW